MNPTVKRIYLLQHDSKKKVEAFETESLKLQSEHTLMSLAPITGSLSLIEETGLGFRTSQGIGRIPIHLLKSVESSRASKAFLVSRSKSFLSKATSHTHSGSRSQQLIFIPLPPSPMMRSSTSLFYFQQHSGFRMSTIWDPQQKACLGAQGNHGTT